MKKIFFIFVVFCLMFVFSFSAYALEVNTEPVTQEKNESEIIPENTENATEVNFSGNLIVPTENVTELATFIYATEPVTENVTEPITDLSSEHATEIILILLFVVVGFLVCVMLLK